MKVLVIGASGATGKHLVNQLLSMDLDVKIIVRDQAQYPKEWDSNNKLHITKANVSEITPNDMAKLIIDCDSVTSCLGHNLSWRGVYGKPRKLVTDATKLLCKAIEINQRTIPVKLILMNTAGNQNRDLDEHISIGEKMVTGLIRLLLPPHSDNENAADFLRKEIGQNHKHIEWAAVRPDGLINEEEVSEYSAHISPTTSAIFKAGKTSRINVGNFMASLATQKDLWNKWKGKMPVIYNVES